MKSGSPPAHRDAPSNISPDMHASVLALNNAHVTELSRLDPESLSKLIGLAFYARQIGDVAAFLIALNESVDYDNPNHRWFRARYSRFIYVDRLAVDQSARGRGYARNLYADLIARAVAAADPVIVCEVNSDPPNPASNAFHAKLGFMEVGTASIHNRSKAVRYLALPLRPLLQQDASRGSSWLARTAGMD